MAELFEMCVLTGICYAIYHKISSHWNPGDGYGNLTLLARGVGVFLVTVMVLQPQQNIKYYVSIISNSLFLLLVSINTILVLTFLSFGSVESFVDGNGSYIVTKWFVITCINFLILDIYAFTQHCDHIDLLGKVWSALVDYYCVSATAFIAVYLLWFSVAHLFVILLHVYGILHFITTIVILGDSIISALTVWITYTVASSLGASTFIKMEISLQGYTLIIRFFTFILLAALSHIFIEVFASDLTMRIVSLLVVVTLVTTAAAVGVALDVPLPEQGADTAVPNPLPEQDGFCAAGNMRHFCCQEISRDDPHHIKPGQLLHLHCIDPEGNRFTLKQEKDTVDSPPLTSAHLTTPPLTPATPPTQTLPSSPHVPPDSSSTPSPTPTQRCREIDREDSRAMELGQLVHLHYLDQEGERRALKVMDEVAGSWKKLGTLFNYDVNRIALNHMGGDFVTDCCLDVLQRWFRSGRARGYPSSWSGLIQALRDIDLNRVANDIDIALKCVVD